MLKVRWLWRQLYRLIKPVKIVQQVPVELKVDQHGLAVYSTNTSRTKAFPYAIFHPGKVIHVDLWYLVTLPGEGYTGVATYYATEQEGPGGRLLVAKDAVDKLVRQQL